MKIFVVGEKLKWVIWAAGKIDNIIFSLFHFPFRSFQECIDGFKKIEKLIDD